MTFIVIVYVSKALHHIDPARI